jgi:hypothetical protein
MIALQVNRNAKIQLDGFWKAGERLVAISGQKSLHESPDSPVDRLSGSRAQFAWLFAHAGFSCLILVVSASGVSLVDPCKQV